VSFDPAKVFGGVLDSSSIILGPNLRKNHEKQDGHKKVVGPIKAQEAERAHGGRVVVSNVNHAPSEAQKAAKTSPKPSGRDQNGMNLLQF
jgi:hypothetical protein